jgi:hypothetical protein
MLPVSPLFEHGPLGRAALLTLISLRVLLPTRGDVGTVSPMENGRHVGPTKRQDVTLRVLRQPIGIAWMAATEIIDSSSPEDVGDHIRLW